MSTDSPKTRAERIHPKHYHVEEDGWYCCGACSIEGGCLDESRRGKCDCGLETRRSFAAAEIRSAEAIACAKAWNDCRTRAVAVVGQRIGYEAGDRVIDALRALEPES